MNTSPRKTGLLKPLATVAAFLIGSQPAIAQNAADEEDTIILPPFQVDSSADVGYLATSSLAGTRLRTELRDIGSSVSVLTPEFLEDLSGTDAQQVLAYTTGFEVSGSRGNFLGSGFNPDIGTLDELSTFFNPSANTRVRGLVNADNARDYFRTTVGWDSYNVSRIDLLRGPNAILFGLGSPGGVVNAQIDQADVSDSRGQISTLFDQFGTKRLSLNYNQVILEDELAVRIAFLTDNKRFRQDPAFENDNRMYFAAAWRPSWVNKQDGMFMELNVSHEAIKERSNRPRGAPPADAITPFFEPTVIQPIQLPEGTNFNGFAGGVIPGAQLFTDGFITPEFGGIDRSSNPIGVNTSFNSNGVRLHVVSDDPADDFYRLGRMSATGVLQANGSIYTGNPAAGRRLFGVGYLDQTIGTLNNVTGPSQLNHPFDGAFRPISITDPSIFDFYTTLLDGDNKREWLNADQTRLALTHTFFDGMVGYEASFYRERADRGQLTLLSDNQRIFIDINGFDIEGNPNPNVGRAFVQEQTSTGTRRVEDLLEAWRVSAFFDYDFRDKDSSSLWRRIAGRHVFNAVYNSDRRDTDSRRFTPLTYGSELLDYVGGQRWPRFNNNTRVALRYYISDDLRGRSDLSGANFSNLSRRVNQDVQTITARIHDNTYLPTAPAPNVPWTNPLGQNWEQAANPANYVGWVDREFELVNAFSGDPADFDTNTNDAILTRSEVNSRIFTWQGYGFDGIIVGTYGWRKDISDNVRVDPPSGDRPNNGAVVTPEVYNLDNPDPSVRTSFAGDTISKNWSAVAHLTQLPFLNKSPINVSFTYNKGQNFNPTSARRDSLNNILPPPSGSTREWGFLLATRDNKYVMRIQRYKTSVLTDTAPSFPSNFRFQQFFGNQGAVAAFRADPANGLLRQDFENQTTPPDFSIDDQENIHAPAWYAFEADFEAAFPEFIDTFLDQSTWNPSTDLTTFNIFGRGGVLTQDTVSKGVEMEFTANPTNSLRLTMNVSRTNAIRDNVPGPSFLSIFNFVTDALFNDDGTPSDVGLLREAFDWQNSTQADFWNREVVSNVSTILTLNGQRTPEIAKWKVNGVANYAFREGMFKGFGVGGALRYQSKGSTGYPRFFDENGDVAVDVDNPFKGEVSVPVDIWFRYESPLTDSVDWSIQLHVFNALGSNKLIPIATNPDGTDAAFRIQEGKSIRVTNNFKF